MGLPTRSTLEEDALLVGYVLFVVVAYVALFALWGRLSYVGSFEWILGKLLGSGKATRIDRLAVAARGGAPAAAATVAATAVTAAAVTAAATAATAAATARATAGAAAASNTDEGPGDDVATVWIWILTITWTPAATWVLLSWAYLAPSMDDFYHTHNASHVFLTPAAAGGPSPEQTMRLGINAELFVVTYAAPIAGCLLRLAWLRCVRKPEKSKVD